MITKKSEVKNKIAYLIIGLAVLCLFQTAAIAQPETYDLAPSQRLLFPEKGWKNVYEREKLFPSGDYRIILTLDDNVTKTYQGAMDAWSVVDFKIHSNESIEMAKMMS